MHRSDELIHQTLLTHIAEDERRFDRIEAELARIKGMLTVLVVLVVGSGLVNIFAHTA